MLLEIVSYAMLETDHEMPDLRPQSRRLLLKALRRTRAQAKISGNAFMVVMFTARGEVTMYQTSGEFRIVKEDG